MSKRDRLPIDIDNEVLKHFSLQTKCEFPMHKVYAENGIPLPALPYRFIVEKAEKTTHYVTRQLLNPPEGVDASPTTSSQEYCCWSTSRNGYYPLMDKYDQARNLLDEKVNNGILARTKAQSIPIMMLYAERKETMLAVTNVVERFIAGFRAIRHPYRLYKAVTGNKPSRSMKRKLKASAARVTRKASTVADAWLEYRYVWSPLVHDVYDSVLALKKQKQKMYRYEQSYGDYVEMDYKDLVSVWSQPYDAEAHLKGSYGTHIKYFYDVENPLLTAWSSLTDTAAFLWDLAPGSFIWDWFMDVSTWLDLRSATWGLSFTDGYKSQIRVITTSFKGVSYTVTDWWWPFYTTSYDTTGLEDHFYLYTDRVVLTNFPTVQLSFPLEDGLNLKRVTDLYALGISLLSRKLNRPLPHKEAYKYASN